MLLLWLQLLLKEAFVCAGKLPGEVSEDGGGPRREFWHLLGRDIQTNVFEGDP